MFVKEHKIDVIALTETLSKFESAEDQSDINFIIPGFTNYQNNSGRGVCVFIKDTFSVTQMMECESMFSPLVYCKISSKGNDSFIRGTVYRSPNSSHDENEQLLKQINQVSQLATKQMCKLLLVGDFNFREINWENESCGGTDENKARKFLNCIQKNYLSQFVRFPTHKRADQNPTLIDLVIANDPDFVLDLQHHAPFGASHHEVLTFVLDYIVSSNDLKPTEKHLLDKGDYVSMRKEVGEVDWDNLLNDSESVDQWWDNLENVLNSAKEKFIPKKKIPTNKVNRSFVAPKSLLETIQLKRKTYKLYEKYPTIENYAMY